MYNLCAHWVKSFLNETFFAGMMTSGRSENIHSFSDMHAEEDGDFKTMTSKAALSSDHPIQQKTGYCYTNDKDIIQHILYIFKKKKIIDLTLYYILPRWTINDR
ncbi:hypothetical protein RJ640_008211 [Escallonia rubra]|uniref:Uncharacterized protein n=1 Tax=Escallonia rubra TaxID=112253 RepID=A0AA88R295_9ASTE|nr:hypothetical protein RJ640_008211 [Escallonia rubra]